MKTQARSHSSPDVDSVPVKTQARLYSSPNVDSDSVPVKTPARLHSIPNVDSVPAALVGNAPDSNTRLRSSLTHGALKLTSQ